MIWINGENFYSAKENGLLYGPFTDKLPNMEAYIDQADPETLNDFCMPIEGYEAPYAKAQMVFYADTAVTPDLPASAEELMALSGAGTSGAGCSCLGTCAAVSGWAGAGSELGPVASVTIFAFSSAIRISSFLFDGMKKGPDFLQSSPACRDTSFLCL